MTNHNDSALPRFGRKFKARDSNRFPTVPTVASGTSDAVPLQPESGEVLAQPIGVVSEQLLLASFRKQDAPGLGETARAPAHLQDIRELDPVKTVKLRGTVLAEDFRDELTPSSSRSSRRKRPLPPQSLELFVDDLD